MYFVELRGNDAKTEGGNTVSLRYHCGRQMGFCSGFTRVHLDLCKLHHTHQTTLTKAPDKKCLIQIDEISRGQPGVFCRSHKKSLHHVPSQPCPCSLPFTELSMPIGLRPLLKPSYTLEICLDCTYNAWNDGFTWIRAAESLR